MLTGHAAELLADSARLLAQSADADFLSAASCPDVVNALGETLTALSQALSVIEDCAPGKIPRCAEVLAQLDSISVLLAP